MAGHGLLPSPLQSLIYWPIFNILVKRIAWRFANPWRRKFYNFVLQLDFCCTIRVGNPWNVQISKRCDWGSESQRWEQTRLEALDCAVISSEYSGQCRQPGIRWKCGAIILGKLIEILSYVKRARGDQCTTYIMKMNQVISDGQQTTEGNSHEDKRLLK